MKKMLLSITLAMVASFAWGQTTRQPLMNERQVPQQPPRQTTTTQTTSTTEATGTITDTLREALSCLERVRGR